MRTLRRALAVLCACTLLLQLTACGTLLYPERHGLRGGRVDPAVLLFDGALLLLFIVPGVIAYGIDFHTGAVYLPPGGRVSVIDVDPRELDAARVDALVREHTGRDAGLADPRLEVRALAPGHDPRIALADLRRLE